MAKVAANTRCPADTLLFNNNHTKNYKRLKRGAGNHLNRVSNRITDLLKG